MIIEKTSDIYTGAIRAFLAANFFLDDADDLEASASLLEHGIMDSTGVLEVVGFIEHTFGITVEDSEILPRNLDSIQAIAHFVTRKKNGQSALEL
ncbi:acyl carrier protein [Bosea sp. 2YAB26]|uniref:acyl carrier protein n=1 Tax=Bosea sp. 2YAB26 TaxID=3237478 RepID=UPI003F8F5E1A